MLADKYKASSGDVEVVFVSSDQDQTSFNEYYGTMPWLALPYSARKLKAKISNQFEVRGIPSLIVLNGKTGDLITKDGRAQYESLFRPASPRSVAAAPPPAIQASQATVSAFNAMFGTKLLRGQKTVNTSEVLGDHRRIAVYFSAHWCPPCRRFTPILANKYKNAGENRDTEVIFVSSDQNQASFDEYFGEMPWLALPFSERELKGKLSQKYGVSGIPTLVLLDGQTGELLTKDGRAQVESLFKPSKLRSAGNPPTTESKADCGSVCAGCTVC